MQYIIYHSCANPNMYVYYVMYIFPAEYRNMKKSRGKKAFVWPKFVQINQEL